MMTLVAFLALRKCFIYQKSAKLRMNGAKGMKKQQTKKKDPKKSCAKNWDPYNAPPLRRQSETLHKMVVTAKRKILKIRVDSERGKRNIR
ncbi:TPA: hypothetical protein U2I12_004739, partial [Citrobacter farmeri]|nr:hypothetical protein [Citrobacter farmeri]